MKKGIIIFLLIFFMMTLLGQCSKNSEKSFKDNDKDTESDSSYSATISGSGVKKDDSEKNVADKKDKDSREDNTSKHISVGNKGKSKEQNTKSSKSKKVEDYYGKWDVKKVAAYANNNRTSESNCNDVIGKTIEFSKDKISYDGKGYEKPSYTTKEITNSEFNKSYHKNLSDFQIKDSSVQELKIGNSENIGIGNEYIWKNNDTLIMIKNGDCYELKKR